MLLRFDGFDGYNNASDLQQRTDLLQWQVSSFYGFPTPGRAGYGKYLQLTAGGGLTARLANQYAGLSVGFGFDFLSFPQLMYFSFGDSIEGLQHCQFVFNPINYTITFIDATGATKQTALNSFVNLGWMWYELSVDFSTTEGKAGIRVNGQPLPSFPDLTGLNTQNGPNLASYASLQRQSLSGQQSFSNIDDFYIADHETGPGSFPNNAFLGDVRADSLFPVGNNVVTWTPLSPDTNWQNVSETAMDGDTTYNSTAAAGAQDSFNLGALDVDVNQVLGLQVQVAIRKEDAGSRTVAPVLVIGGVTYQGTAVSVDVTYLYIISLWPINPATGASWTAEDVNGLAAGYVVVT